MGYDTYHRRQLAHFVSQTSATVAYDTRILVVDSYATIRRSMRRTAAVVTRVRRDPIKREVDYHIFIIRLLLLDLIYILVSLRIFVAHLLTILFRFSIGIFIKTFLVWLFFGFVLLTNIDVYLEFICF
jgi:lipopolysaccharide/colanic/teichoic acid biosynthesis glycosyltransferase